MTEPRVEPAGASEPPVTPEADAAPGAPAAAGAPGEAAGPEAPGAARPAGTPERPAHRDANVLRWLGAYASSLVGDTIYFLALGWAAAQAGRPAEVGMIMAVGAIPRAVLMLGGGVVADRIGPRRIVIGSDAVRCVVIIGIAAALLLTGPQVWLLVVVALVFGAVDALFLPAVGALPPRITTPGQLVRVQGLKALTNRFGGIVGAPVAGLAMGLGGPAAAFAVAGGLFAVSLVLLVALKVAPLPEKPAGEKPGDAGEKSGDTGEMSGDQEEKARERSDRAPDGSGPGRTRSVWQDLTDGLGYIRRHRLIGPLVLSNLLFELGGIPLINVGIVLLSADRGWGAPGVASVVGAFSVGAAASAMLLTVRGRLARAGTVRLLALTGGSVMVAVLGTVPALGWAIAVAAPMGMLVALSGGLTAGLLQTTCDPAYLGRVTSVTSLVSLGIAPLAYPLVGLATGLWGVSPVFLGCAAVCLSAALIGVTSAEVRGAELPEPKK
ncbi:MFS transporter [Streptomyces sp. NPDC004111]|uniref:MFS transporter n=1 Tax=Streptomyces sp. NPDC004111 TaxID=3364690 RepID=UPI0036C2AAFB